MSSKDGQAIKRAPGSTRLFLGAASRFGEELGAYRRSLNLSGPVETAMLNSSLFRTLSTLQVQYWRRIAWRRVEQLAGAG